MDEEEESHNDDDDVAVALNNNVLRVPETDTGVLTVVVLMFAL